MKLKYEASFGKDLRKVQDKILFEKIKNTINDIKLARDIRSIKNLKKLKGY